MKVSISRSSFYMDDEDASTSPPLTPTSPVSPVSTTYRGSTIDLDLGASLESSLSLSNSFSPRSSKKRSKERKRGSRKRNAKNKVEHKGNNDNNAEVDDGGHDDDQSSAGGSSSASANGGRVGGKKDVVEYVLPGVLAKKVSNGEVEVEPSRLADFVKKMGRQEYKAIVKSCRAPRSWAEKLQLFPGATSYFAYAKNRYRDVLADEKTRIRLVGLEHDYINANLISGSNLPGHPKGKYIACQAPLPSTIPDFWWMVWQEKSCVIVMLTRFREKGTLKAHPYWPQEEGEEGTYGNFDVKLVSEKAVSGICINTLRVTKRGLGGEGVGEQRMVYHLFYSEWPDFGVPKSTKSLRSLISYTNLYSDRGKTDGANGPIVCHCSAGIGRTGTFIAVHAGIELIEATVIPDVPGMVTAMRSCRSGMIQTDAQYLFVYEALNDHIYQFSEAKRPQRVTSACSVALAPPKNRSKLCKGRCRSISAVMSKEDMMIDENESVEEEEKRGG